MKRVGKNSIALGLVIALVSLALSFSASGATAKVYSSYGEAQYVAAIDSALGGLLVDPLVDAVVEDPAGARACEPATKDCPAFASTKSPLGDALKPLTGGIGDALSTIKGNGVGVIGDYARAGASNQSGAKPGASKAASGAVSSEGAVDLSSAPDPSKNYASFGLSSGVLAPIAESVADVRFELGAVAASAQLNSPTSKVTRDYGIAGANIVLDVNGLSEITGALGLPAGGLPDVADINLVALCDAIGGTLEVTTAKLLGVTGGTLVDLLLSLGLPLGTTSVNICGAIPDEIKTQLEGVLNIKITGLDAVTSGLESTLGNGVVFDFANDQIRIDLAKMVESVLGKNINSLPQNTDLLASVLPALTANLDNIVDNLSTELVGKLKENFDVKVTLAGTDLPIGALTAGIREQLLPLIQTVLDGVAGGLDTVSLSLIDSVLKPITDGLSNVAQLIVNVPDVYANAAVKRDGGLLPGLPGVSAAKAGDKSGVFSETALRVRVLGGQGADLLLGNALVGPNSEGAVDDQAGDQAAAAAGDGNQDTIADANADANADAVADANADANADADVTSALPNTGAPNVLPLLLLALGLVGFGSAVLANEKRRLAKQ